MSELEKQHKEAKSKLYKTKIDLNIAESKDEDIESMPKQEEYLSEKLHEVQQQITESNDAFDEIYTDYDLSVDNDYIASSGYPFDNLMRWLHDP